MPWTTGRGLAVRRLLWEQEIGGSIPPAPRASVLPEGVGKIREQVF